MDHLITFLIGLLYGGGLMISEVLRPSKIIGFFALDTDKWDPTLLIVMLTVIIMNLFIFFLAYGRPNPIEEHYELLDD